MPYTIIYTEAPCCCYCGRELTSWTAFAEVHYHEECHADACAAELRQKLQHLVDSWKAPKDQVHKNGGPDAPTD